MNFENKYIRFDWAVKRMLRDKANFGVLEGLITVLLGEPVHIVELLESEVPMAFEDDKFKRLDVLATNKGGEKIIVELHLTRYLYYLECILFGLGRTLSKYLQHDTERDAIRKVYSISVVFFDIGRGCDYLYISSKNKFEGVNTHDTLYLNSKEYNSIYLKTPEEVFPEYYIIRVNEFNDVAKTPLEEWMDYLKNGHIKDDTTAPGLCEAKEKLQYLSMDKKDRIAYERHLDAIMVQEDVLSTAKLEGHAEGHAEGLAEGLAEGRADVACNLKKMGLPIEKIVQATGLTPEEIEKL